MYTRLNMLLGEMGLGLTVLSLLIWFGLLGFRGQFWRTDQRLEEIETPPQPTPSELYPSICAVVPARNEAELLPVTFCGQHEMHAFGGGDEGLVLIFFLPGPVFHGRIAGS